MRISRMVRNILIGTTFTATLWLGGMVAADTVAPGVTGPPKVKSIIKRLSTTTTTPVPTTSTTVPTAGTTSTTLPAPPKAEPRIDFVDVAPSSPYYFAARWALEHGYIIGEKRPTGAYVSRFLDPKERVTRAEAKLILWRMGIVTPAEWQKCQTKISRAELFDHYPALNHVGLQRNHTALSRGQLLLVLFESRQKGIGYRSLRTGYGGATPHTETMWHSVKYAIPSVRFLGARAYRPYYSEHLVGRALDIGGSWDTMVAVNRYFVKHMKQFNVKYTIFDRRIYFPNGTSRHYYGASPHRDHVHISFYR